MADAMEKGEDVSVRKSALPVDCRKVGVSICHGSARLGVE